MLNQNLPYWKEVHDIIGAAMAVHRYFGCGFTEKVYQDALEVEFADRDIPSQREPELQVIYKDKMLSSSFKPDFICYNRIIVELKAVKELDDMHRSQAINCGKISGSAISLLINFGEPSLRFERFAIS